MNKRLFLLSCSLLLLSCTAFAQMYVGDSKGHVKNWMGIRAGKYDKTSTKTETDSSYTYLFRGEVKPTDIYFLFDKKNKCRFEKWTFDCDTCYNHLLPYILHKGRYKWKLTGNNEYLSKASKQLKLKADISKLTFTITQLYMSEKDYLVLYNQAARK